MPVGSRGFSRLREDNSEFGARRVEIMGVTSTAQLCRNTWNRFYNRRKGAGLQAWSGRQAGLNGKSISHHDDTTQDLTCRWRFVVSFVPLW
jgi:hypothetical protein